MCASAAPTPWEFACDLYNRDGVKTALLALQDEAGVDISFFLFALWSGRYHRALSDGELTELTSVATVLAKKLVQPLRNARRSLNKHSPASSALYRQLRDTELACEKYVLEVLEDRLPDKIRTDGGSVKQGIQNGERYLALAEIDRSGKNDGRLAVLFRAFETASL